MERRQKYTHKSHAKSKPLNEARVQGLEGSTAPPAQVLTGRCLGERWRMVVPPHLAYGDGGSGDVIPGGATLTFDVRRLLLHPLLMLLLNFHLLLLLWLVMVML